MTAAFELPQFLHTEFLQPSILLVLDLHSTTTYSGKLLEFGVENKPIGSFDTINVTEQRLVEAACPYYLA